MVPCGRPRAPPLVDIHKGTSLFENQPAAPGGERWGPVHYAFQVAPDELEEAAEHVRSHGIEVWGPHQFDDAADAYFFYDPDDNLVESSPTWTRTSRLRHLGRRESGRPPKVDAKRFLEGTGESASMVSDLALSGGYRKKSGWEGIASFKKPRERTMSVT